MEVLEADGSYTTLSAETWRRICADLGGMRVCQTSSTTGHRLVKRKRIVDSDEDVECTTKHDSVINNGNNDACV
jgi:hypothetical protein